SGDNGVARAKSGYRPTITGTVTTGFDDMRTRFSGQPQGFIPAFPNSGSATNLSSPATHLSLGALSDSSFTNGTSIPRSAQIALQQNIFDGFQTYNAVKGSEALVEAGREDLRTAEQTVLLNAATAYMNVVRDEAIVNARRNNIRVLSEQLRATQDRFK